MLDLGVGVLVEEVGEGVVEEVVWPERSQHWYSMEFQFPVQIVVLSIVVEHCEDILNEGPCKVQTGGVILVGQVASS